MPHRDSPCSEDAFVAQHPPDHSSSFNVMLLLMAKIPRELIPRIQEMDCRGQNMMERCTLRGYPEIQDASFRESAVTLL
jgi:hypothetical protein